MRICMVSPARWRYTARLCEELCKIGHCVYLFTDERPTSEVNEIDLGNCHVKGVWMQKSFLPWFITSIICNFLKAKAHIMHIQFEYLIFGRFFSSLFFPLLLVLLKLLSPIAKFRLAITLHSVVSLDKASNALERGMLLFYTKAVIKLSEKAIVHTSLAKKVLISQYTIAENKLFVIPHGIETKSPSVVQEDLRNLRTELNATDEKIILHFGIIRLSKGLRKLAKAFRQVLKRERGTIIVVAGWTHEYLGRLRVGDIISFFPVESRHNVRVINRYLNREELVGLISLSDVICLPYERNYVIGVSGALADIVMFGKPVVVTKCLKFAEFMNFPNILLADDEESLAARLVEALHRPEHQLQRSIYLNNRSWASIAERTSHFYNELLSLEGC